MQIVPRMVLARLSLRQSANHAGDAFSRTDRSPPHHEPKRPARRYLSDQDQAGRPPGRSRKDLKFLAIDSAFGLSRAGEAHIDLMAAPGLGIMVDFHNIALCLGF